MSGIGVHETISLLARIAQRCAFRGADTPGDVGKKWMEAASTAKKLHDLIVELTPSMEEEMQKKSKPQRVVADRLIEIH